MLFSGLANYCCCILCTVCLECNEIHHQVFEHENVVWLTMHIIPICFVDCAIMKSSKFWAGGKMRNAIIRNLTCTTVKSSMINICLLCILCWCVKDMWQISVPFPPLFFLPFPLYYINCNHLSWPFKHELNTVVLCMLAIHTWNAFYKCANCYNILIPSILPISLSKGKASFPTSIVYTRGFPTSIVYTRGGEPVSPTH